MITPLSIYFLDQFHDFGGSIRDSARSHIDLAAGNHGIRLMAEAGAARHAGRDRAAPRVPFLHGTEWLTGIDCRSHETAVGAFRMMEKCAPPIAGCRVCVVCIVATLRDVAGVSAMARMQAAEPALCVPEKALRLTMADGQRR